MANNCYGFVQFQGDKVQEALDYVQHLQDTSIDDGFQLVENEDQRALFDVQTDDGTLKFITKWDSEVNQIKALADMFDLAFTYDYEELGWNVYGRWIYNDDKTLEHYKLEDEHFDMYSENEDCEYYFRGEHWESESEILDTLLDEVIKEAKK